MRFKTCITHFVLICFLSLQAHGPFTGSFTPSLVKENSSQFLAPTRTIDLGPSLMANGSILLSPHSGGMLPQGEAVETKDRLFFLVAVLAFSLVKLSPFLLFVVLTLYSGKLLGNVKKELVREFLNKISRAQNKSDFHEILLQYKKKNISLYVISTVPVLLLLAVVMAHPVTVLVSSFFFMVWYLCFVHYHTQDPTLKLLVDFIVDMRFDVHFEEAYPILKNAPLGVVDFLLPYMTSDWQTRAVTILDFLVKEQSVSRVAQVLESLLTRATTDEELYQVLHAFYEISIEMVEELTPSRLKLIRLKIIDRQISVRNIDPETRDLADDLLDSFEAALPETKASIEGFGATGRRKPLEDLMLSGKLPRRVEAPEEIHKEIEEVRISQKQIQEQGLEFSDAQLAEMIIIPEENPVTVDQATKAVAVSI